MDINLTPDQIVALNNQGGSIQVVDPSTNRVYVVVDLESHRQAVAAKRKLEDLQAIQQGLDDMQAGRMQPLEEAFADIRKKLLDHTSS